MGKPLVFRALGALHRFLPRRTLSFIFSAAGSPAPRRVLDSIFGRILSFQKKPATREVLDALEAEQRERYADTLLNLCALCHDASRLPQEVSLDLLPALEKLREKKRGVILATPHFGDINLAIAALALAGVPLNVFVVGRFSLRLYRWFEREKLRFLRLGEGAADALKALRNNEAVLLFDDLDLFAGNRAAELFGAPVNAPHGAARLALAAGAAILPVYMVFRDGRCRLSCDEPILIEEDAVQEAIEARLSRSMERFIGEHPAQWFLFKDIWNLEAMRDDSRWARLF